MRQFLIQGILGVGSLLLSFGAEAMEGTYTVPVDPELADHAQFVVENYEMSKSDSGREFMKFNLPADLMGMETRVSFGEVKPGPVTGYQFRRFESSQGSVVCTGQWNNLACVVRFEGLPNQPEAREAHFQRAYGGDSDIIEQKRKVADQFHTEPIGFMGVRAMNDSE